MHVRIPSRVITATLELALLAGSLSPVTATPITFGDLSALFDKSPKQDQNQQVLNEASSPIISSPKSSSNPSPSANSDSGSSKITCSYNSTINPQSSGQAAGLFACIAGFETDSWAGGDCGGQSFYKGHNSLFPSKTDSKEGGGSISGAKECYQECESCLVEGVVDGASSVECKVSRGVMDVSRCWVGIK